MHEAGIIQSVLTIAEKTARDSGSAGIQRIRMRIGILTGIVEEALQHAFLVLREDTLAEKAELRVEYLPGRSWCSFCNNEFTSGDLLLFCPECGRPSGEVRGGLEMELVSIDVD